MIDYRIVSDSLNKVISETKKNNSTLFVLAGISSNSISGSVEKLFEDSFSINIINNDEEKREKLRNSVLKSHESNKAFFCSISEYLILGESLKDFFNVIYIKNPIYKNLLPSELILEEAFVSDENISEELESEYGYPVYLSEYVSSKLDKTIGQFYIINDKLYIVPVNEISWVELKFENIKYEIEENTIKKEFVITEDEGSWINFINEIIKNEFKSFEIFISSEALRIEYENSIKSLIAVSLNNITLGKDSKPNIDKIVFPEIKKILYKFWNVKDFRNFRVYHDVRSSSDIVIKNENQENVILDILTQVNLAQEKKPYRDVFITAPTGTGKSLMFQLPAIHLHSLGLLTIIVSPLIALMNDQTQSLYDKGILFSASINSSLSIIEKEDIITKIQKGDISILYLSPETLLSRFDIKNLIGDRKIGLFVIDEAHIVTTWGKAFRPDYWYLGNYIQKLRKDQNFPITTFTATAIYKGPEDMYSETRDSLAMRNPITYFGYVPRENINIEFDCANYEGKSKEYRFQKFKILSIRLSEYKMQKKKVLVYFPFVTLINEYQQFLSLRENGIAPEDIAIFYGNLHSSEKEIYFQRFRNNESLIMLATKAFGMGVDIPDIDIVYHFAPTGNVCDYIQEIGRAARIPSNNGLAQFDYLQKDFSFVNRLHGMSTIQNSELLSVMKKVYEIGRSLGFKRNLLVSSDSFQLIFDNTISIGDDLSELDGKIKTALLLIEKDSLLKFGFSPIVARPRSLFTVAWFRITENHAEEIEEKINGFYSIESDLYKIDLKLLWARMRPDLSFANFKWLFYTNQKDLGFSCNGMFTPMLQISIHKTEDQIIKDSPLSFLDYIIDFCNDKMQNGDFFNLSDVEMYLSVKYTNVNKYQLKRISKTVILFLKSWNKYTENNYGRFMVSRSNEQNDERYRITGSGFSDLNIFLKKTNLDLIENRMFFIEQDSEDRGFCQRLFAMLGLLESCKILSFEVMGGGKPEIFIRVNSYFRLFNYINNPDIYSNKILKNVHFRHRTSVTMLDFLFKSIKNDSPKFWDHIQNYFLGNLPPEIECITSNQ